MTASPSYRDILRSSTIVGGSQGVQIALKIVQVKVLAILLGPIGVGIVGLYQAAINIATTIFGLGIRQSGVRQVAEVVSTGDQQKVGLTFFTLRRITVILGIVGMGMVFIARKKISQITFGNTEHENAFAIMSLILFFRLLFNGQTALVQGMRRIGDFAKLTMLGAFGGLLSSIVIIYIWGQSGIAPYLVAVSAMMMSSSWWYSRKIRLPKVTLKIRDILVESKSLIALGIMLMLSTLMTFLVMYLIRVMVVRWFGLEAVGLYQAAAQLSNVYIGFILGAMGLDFYPRLTAAADDNPTCNRLVNEQSEIGLLMATPGLLATLTFAPLVIQLFYSSKFIPAYDILQWQVMGTFIRVVSWPMGIVQLAKGAGKVFFMTQFTANAVHVLFIWLATRYFGLVGTGIAFFALYVFHVFFIYAVTKYLSGFSWSSANKHLGLVIAPAVVATFLLTQFLSPLPGMAAGTILTFVMGIYCLKKLHKLVGSPTMATIFAKFKQKLGWKRY